MSDEKKLAQDALMAKVIAAKNKTVEAAKPELPKIQSAPKPAARSAKPKPKRAAEPKKTVVRPKRKRSGANYKFSQTVTTDTGQRFYDMQEKLGITMGAVLTKAIEALEASQKNK